MIFSDIWLIYSVIGQFYTLKSFQASLWLVRDVPLLLDNSVNDFSSPLLLHWHIIILTQALQIFSTSLRPQKLVMILQRKL